MDLPEDTSSEAEKLPTRRVHILGLGSIGTLIAHALQVLPNPPPISLLMHRQEVFTKFKVAGRIIRLLNPNNDVNDEQSGYDVDVFEPHQTTGKPYWTHMQHEGKNHMTNELQPGETLESGEVFIYTLIVTVKGPRTRVALESVKHRMNAQSTICLVQNGMGQIDELNKHVFTDPATRPTYILGIITHGAHMSGPFAVIHAGFGTTALGIYRDTDKFPFPPKTSNFDPNMLSQEERRQMYPTEEDLYANLSSRYLLRTMTRSPVLACAPFPYLDLLQLQLEKLVTNCILNPITAILNIPNGSMLDNASISRIQRLLLAEISLVLRNLPELEGVPGVNARFSPARLETLCNSLAKRTAQNSSSMREDVRRLIPTEVYYINGYIVRRGEQLGIKCVLNYMLMKLISAKTEIAVGKEPDIEPYGTSSVEGDVSPIGADPEGAVMLEDRGTQLKGKPY